MLINIQKCPQIQSQMVATIFQNFLGKGHALRLPSISMHMCFTSHTISIQHHHA